MFDELFRRYKDVWYRPVVRMLGGISPNTVTLTACAFGLGAAVAAWATWYGFAFGLWLVNRLLDGLDGAIAREGGRQTDFGGYLDILLDFVVYAAIPIGLALGQPTVEVLLALAGLLGSYYINAGSWMYLSAVLEKRALGARARGEATTVTMPSGLVGAVMSWFAYALFLLWPAGVSLTFSFFAVAVMVTAGQRLVWAARALRTPSPAVMERPSPAGPSNRSPQLQ
jgi:phosphatidylglycerophosphate synthase